MDETFVRISGIDVPVPGGQHGQTVISTPAPSSDTSYNMDRGDLSGGLPRKWVG